LLFSLAWLRELSPFEANAREVARRLTARGLTVESVSEATGDPVLDVDVPANRPDCLGHRGLAREVAAAFGAPLAALPTTVLGARPESAEAIRVEIDAPDLCARYTARIVRGVRVGPSPAWVVSRLAACGVRSISNVVDASNLVLLEIGQPVHFFDAARLTGRALRVRRALPGESLRTLDGVVRALGPEMLVIADGDRAAALAGILGGFDSEIGPSTTEVLVEAAWFRPASVRATSRILGVRTEASHRFERGTDIEAPIAAQQLAARLLEELASGEAAAGTVDVYPAPRPPLQLSLRLDRIERLLGYTPPPDRVLAALSAVHLAPRAIDVGRIEVTVPSWRVDLGREPDLVEEVARHEGYDAIPVSLDGLPCGVPHPPDDDPEGRARAILASIGFQEAFGYAMIGEGEDDEFVRDAPKAERLVNPIADPLAYLRRSLLPSLLRSVDTNHRRGARDVRLFEVGRVFWFERPPSLPTERRCAAIAWSGAARPQHWSEPPVEIEFPDVAGVVERVLSGVWPGQATTRRLGGPAALHPGRSAYWTVADGTVVARAGALHPTRQRAFEHPIWLAEIDLDTLAAFPATAVRSTVVPRLSPVSRDLSLRMPRDRSFEGIARALRSVPAPAPARFEVLDRYEGPPLAADELSLTVRVHLAPDERTLVDAEIEAYRSELVVVIERVEGVRLRTE